MEFRKARPEDAEALLEYCRAVGGESDNLNFGPEGLLLSVEAERAYLAKTLESSRDLYLICVEEGAILGAANFRAYGRERLAHRGEFGISVRRTYRHSTAGADHRLCKGKSRHGSDFPGGAQRQRPGHCTVPEVRL